MIAANTGSYTIVGDPTPPLIVQEEHAASNALAPGARTGGPQSTPGANPSGTNTSSDPVSQLLSVLATYWWVVAIAAVVVVVLILAAVIG